MEPEKIHTNIAIVFCLMLLIVTFGNRSLSDKRSTNIFEICDAKNAALVKVQEC